MVACAENVIEIKPEINSPQSTSAGQAKQLKYRLSLGKSFLLTLCFCNTHSVAE